MLAISVWSAPNVYAQVQILGGGGGVASGGNAPDNVFFICDDGDPTKCAAFQASGISTGTTRTYTFPDATITLAGLSTQTFGGTQSFSQVIVGTDSALSLGANGNANNNLSWVSAQTPDAGILGTGSTGNSWIIAERADAATDQQNGSCGSTACTHPELTIMQATAASPQTQYNSQAYWGNAGGARKTLTESSATSTAQISVAAGAGGGGTFNYCVFAADGTDQQQRCGRIKFAVTNKAGTETCGLNTDTAVTNDASISETEDGNAAAISAGTLTYAITCSTSPTNAVDIQINAVSSLTQTTLEARYSVSLIGPGQVTPQ